MGNMSGMACPKCLVDMSSVCVSSLGRLRATTATYNCNVGKDV